MKVYHKGMKSVGILTRGWIVGLYGWRGHWIYGLDVLDCILYSRYGLITLVLFIGQLRIPLRVCVCFTIYLTPLELPGSQHCLPSNVCIVEHVEFA